MQLRDLAQSNKIPVSIADVQKMQSRIIHVSINLLRNKIMHNELIIENVRQEADWDLGTKSRFIETLILGLPTSLFYFVTSENYEWEVLDGVKRINAIVSFLETIVR